MGGGLHVALPAANNFNHLDLYPVTRNLSHHVPHHVFGCESAVAKIPRLSNSAHFVRSV